MKRRIFFLCAILLLAFPADASQLPVVRVFGEITYEVQLAGGFFSRHRSYEFKSVTQGSGFVLTTRNGPYIVTAAHVLAGPAYLAVVGDGDVIVDLSSPRATLTSQSFRVRVSELSLRPVSIFLDRDRDVAILALSSDDWRQLRTPSFRLWQLSPSTIRSQVTIYGFPGQASAPTLHTARVADIQRDFFSVDQSFGPGFSGGPVVDARNRLMGMVSRSTETHTRAVSQTVIEDIMRDLSSKMSPLTEPHVIYIE